MAHNQLQLGWLYHPKFRDMSAYGHILFVYCLHYCAANMTDGEIIAEAMPLIGRTLERTKTGSTKTGLSELLEAGVLEAVNDPPDSYRIHDYLDYNLSRREIQRIQDNARKNGSLGGRKRADNQDRFKHLGSSTSLQAHTIPVHTSPIQSNSMTEKERVGEEGGLGGEASAAAPPPTPANGSLTHKGNGKTGWQEAYEEPDQKEEQMAKQLGVDAGKEFVKFRDYCLAHDKRYKDFHAAFRNWLRRAANPPHPVPRAPQPFQEARRYGR